MIKISKVGRVISITGHADFADYGKDIVCASVSSIVYTTVNGIFNFDSDAIEFRDEDKMLITIHNETKEVKILLNNMFELLRDLEKKYPKNLKIVK